MRPSPSTRSPLRLSPAKSPVRSDPPKTPVRPSPQVPDNDDPPANKRKKKKALRTETYEPLLIAPPESERTERALRRTKGRVEPEPLDDHPTSSNPTINPPVASPRNDSHEKAIPTPKKRNKAASRRRAPSPSPSLTSVMSINLYSRAEDEAIARYVRDNGYISSWKGRAMWEEAERECVAPGRSWQSMKNRFKSILRDKGMGYFVNSQMQQKVAPAFQKNAFTREEDVAIIDYIVANQSYREVRGKGLWVLMEERGVCDGRSWQSLKERFMKRIRPNLDRYENLTEREKSLLQTS